MMQQILELTESMLAFARSEQWDEFLMCNEKRQRLIDHSAFNPLNGQFDTTDLRSLFMMNNQLLDLVSQQRDRHREALLLLQKNARAVSRYRQCS
jgi:hypothetical protein